MRWGRRADRHAVPQPELLRPAGHRQVRRRLERHLRAQLQLADVAARHRRIMADRSGCRLRARVEGAGRRRHPDHCQLSDRLLPLRRFDRGRISPGSKQKRLPVDLGDGHLRHLGRRRQSASFHGRQFLDDGLRVGHPRAGWRYLLPHHHGGFQRQPDPDILRHRDKELVCQLQCPHHHDLGCALELGVPVLVSTNPVFRRAVFRPPGIDLELDRNA